MSSIRYAADIIARHGEQVVVVERLSEPLGLAFPGGGQEDGETLSEAAVREFLEETGLVFVSEGTLSTHASPGRDVRGDAVSTVFYGVAHGTPRGEEGKTRVLLLSESELSARANELIFDHAEMWNEYLSCVLCA